MEWRNIYRGIAMGACDVIPGVSGGTIAVLMGIYDELIQAINGLFSRSWREHLRFLIPLVMGIGVAIITIARLMEWLLLNHSIPTHFFFLGLILGVLPFLFREADVKDNFTIRHYIFLMIGMGLMIAFNYFFNVDEETIIVDRSLMIYLLLFGAGFIGSAAMVLPGISGSFILLVIGVYPTVMHAINEFHWDVIFVTGSGIALGIIVMSKVIHFFLKKFHTSTFALIIGLIIGSIAVIFPGWATNVGWMLVSICTFALGLLCAYFLGKVEHEA